MAVTWKQIAFVPDVVSLQASTPGTAQDGHLNITGTILAGNIYVGDITSRGNELHFMDGTSGEAVGFINYYGYLGGLSEFRDLNISNGKGASIAYFDGSTGNVGIGTIAPGSLFTVNGLINMKNYIVSTLPAGVRGDIAYVTDALLPTFLAIIAGGGAVVTPVFFNGTNWIGF